MVAWLYSMINPVTLTVMEIFLLHYLVYGWKSRDKGGLHADARSIGRAVRAEGPLSVGNMVLLAVLLVLGVYLRTNRADFGNSSLGVYVNLFTMGVFYYLLLVFYLRINQRLSFYYLVIFTIPMDVCDLVIFVSMLRIWGVDVSGGDAGWLSTVLYLAANFALRAAVMIPIRHWVETDRQRSLSGMQLALIVVAMVPYLYMRDLGFWLPLASEDIGSSSVLMLVMTALVTLILVIGTERIVYYHIQSTELLKLQHMVNRQHEQYEMRKEAVDMVNQKYHDMRHHLMGILGMEDVEEIHRYVNSLRRQITPFESFFRTGNQLLDIILTDKMEICQKKNIQLVPTVDGQALTMLEAADLCNIFGNALDNAIESCDKLPVESLRRITLKVCKVQGFLAIYVENPCAVRPDTSEGRLLTTKKDKENHGYGVQGIRLAVEHYQGEMQTEISEGMFVLTVLIPLVAS